MGWAPSLLQDVRYGARESELTSPLQWRSNNVGLVIHWISWEALQPSDTLRSRACLKLRSAREDQIVSYIVTVKPVCT